MDCSSTSVPLTPAFSSEARSLLSWFLGAEPLVQSMRPGPCRPPEACILLPGGWEQATGLPLPGSAPVYMAGTEGNTWIHTAQAGFSKAIKRRPKLTL